MSVINWFNDNQGFMMVLLTFMYVIATVFILGSNRRLINESKLAREQQTMPFVVIGFECIRGGLLALIVSNEGFSTACRVEIKISDDFIANLPDEVYKERMQLLQTSSLTLLPKQRVEYVFGAIGSFGKIKEQQLFGRMVFYDFQEKKYSRNFTINMEGFTSSLIGKSDAMIIDETLKKINKTLEKIEKKQ